MERILMDAITASPAPKPKGKEVCESFAFAKKAMPLFCTKVASATVKTGAGKETFHNGPEVVIDVAGSHGMVGLLFLAFRVSCEK
jgi:hypothetical protein